MKRYESEFKKQLVKLHLEEGRTLESLASEYRMSKSGLSLWVKQYREECSTNTEIKAEYDMMIENRRLRKELAEAKKENEFLKKAAAFFAKEID